MATPDADISIEERARLDGLRRGGCVAALVAGGASLLGAVLQPETFFSSYLFAYFFWLGFPVGGLALLLLHHLVRGAWGFPVQRLLEAAVGTLPVLAVLFVPVFLGRSYVYEWVGMNAPELASRAKDVYLSSSFFGARAIVYFGVWIGLGAVLLTWSSRLDEEARPDLVRRLRGLGAVGLVALVLTVTFAAVDWFMSIEHEWHSSVYGWMVLVGVVLQTLAFAVLMLDRVRDREPIRTLLAPGHALDLGNMILAFLALWGYLAFIQFLVVWQGDLPHEISWYVHRSRGGWEWVIAAVVLFQFLVPGAVLLVRRRKRPLRRLRGPAAVLLAAYVISAYWFVVPGFRPEDLAFYWTDAVVWIGMGGVWTLTYLAVLEARPLAPRHDPRLQRTDPQTDS